VAAIWRFTLKAQLGGAVSDVADVGWHYQTDVGITGSEPSAATMLDKILSHLSTSAHNLGPLVTCLDTGSSFVYASVYERLAPGSTDAPGVASEVLALAGTYSAGSDRLPGGIATYIGLKTAKAGRSYRGGTHWPGSFNSADLTSGGIWEAASTFRVALVTVGDKIIDVISDIDAAGTDLKPVIYSRTRHARGLDPTEDLTSYVLNLTPRFVRRRMRP